MNKYVHYFFILKTFNKAFIYNQQSHLVLKMRHKIFAKIRLYSLTFKAHYFTMLLYCKEYPRATYVIMLGRVRREKEYARQN